MNEKINITHTMSYNNQDSAKFPSIKNLDKKDHKIEQTHSMRNIKNGR